MPRRNLSSTISVEEHDVTAVCLGERNAMVEQGMLENSNVEPVLEMSRMIELSRNYQSTESMIRREDEMRRRGIERLGRVS